MTPSFTKTESAKVAEIETASSPTSYFQAVGFLEASGTPSECHSRGHCNQKKRGVENKKEEGRLETEVKGGGFSTFQTWFLNISVNPCPFFVSLSSVNVETNVFFS